MAIMKAGKLGAVLWLIATPALWACATNGTGPPEARTPDRLKILVEFSVSDETGEIASTGSDATSPARRVATRILSRLDSRARESARVPDLLPIIALEADAATMMRLIRMPEVLSIQPDHEVSILKSPDGMALPGASTRSDANQPASWSDRPVQRND